MINDGVVLNTKLEPPLLVTRVDASSVDITLKSDAIAVVAPLAPDTAIVHTTDRPVRDGAVLVHDSCDADVGLPYTMTGTFPLIITLSPTFTIMTNVFVVTGVDVENVNVDPPSIVLGIIMVEELEEIVQSEAYPVVAPAAVLAVMVHVMNPEAR